MRSWTVCKLIVVCMAALGALAVGAEGASASGSYAPLCEGLGSPAFCQSNFSLAFMVAVDNSSEPTAGDVYMTTLGSTGVWRFTPNGNAAPFSGTNPNISGNELTFPGDSTGAVGVAVDATGNFYVTERDHSMVDKFTAAGEPVPAGTFVLPAGVVATGIAVDDTGGTSSGDIYVADEAGGVIDKFKPNGELITKSTVGGGGASPLVPYELAVDSSGHVYAANHSGGPVQKFNEALGYEGTIGAAGSFGVAVDPSTNNVFIVFENGTIQEYEPNGTSVGSSFGSLSLSFGIAVSGVAGAAQHNVYASDFGSSRGDIFGTGEPPEAPETIGATEITGTTAKLHGVLNPHGATGELGYHFAYNTTGVCEGGGTTPSGTVVEAKEASVETEATGLTPDTEYTFCLVATNPFGPTLGNPLTFTTTAGAPTVESETASEETPTSAKVAATINPGGVETTCKVEYGPSEAYGSELPCSAAIPAGIVGVPVTPILLPGLEANTPYDYRFVATNEKGTVPGPNATFTTTAVKLKPVITYKPPTVSRHEATLPAEINTEESTTNYVLEWGENAEYTGKKSGKIEAELTASTEASKITQALIELEPGTVYHYRIVATNGTGTTEGEDATFRTAAPQPPAVESLSAVQVAQTTATIVTSVNPNGLQTSYALEVGTEVEENGVRRIAYTPTFGEVGEGAETLTLPLSGLLPGTTYHYRVVLTNEDGKAGEETDQTFTTAGFPAVITPPALVTLVPFTLPKEVKPAPGGGETRAQKYTKAVQLCQKIKSKKKRATCMKTAKKKYGPVAKKKHKKK
jgi:hypothetical protein